MKKLLFIILTSYWAIRRFNIYNSNTITTYTNKKQKKGGTLFNQNPIIKNVY